MAAEARLKRIQQAITGERKRLFEIGRFLHAHPELAHEEVRASARLSEYLAGLGFEITTPYGGLKTAFRAVLKGKGRGPSIGVCAEYDALPKLGHACGHNLISVVALAAAAGVAGCGLPRNGCFEIIGTPAEEAGCGKGIMADAGAFDHLDVCYMAHPATENLISRGSLAIRGLDMIFKGKSAHAAASPQEGINALDAAVLFLNGMNAMRQHLREDARVHAIISEGGVASNIIPDRAVLRVGVRSLDQEYLRQIEKRTAACARGAAAALGAKVTIRPSKRYYKAMKINPPLVRLLADAMTDAGLAPQVGSGNEGRGSLDMGNVSQVVPASHPYFNIVPKGHSGKVVGHSHEFARLANEPYAYRQAAKTGAALALTAIRLMTQPRTLQDVRGAFKP